MEPYGGCLCIGCLERRIGRKLKPKDFERNHPFNNSGLLCTERLRDRTGAHARSSSRRSMPTSPAVLRLLKEHRIGLACAGEKRKTPMTHQSRTPPPRPTPAELARDPVSPWRWMEAYWDHALLEGLREINQERDRQRPRLVIDNTKIAPPQA